MHIDIDQIDLKILSELQKNSSQSNQKTAKILGISTPSYLRRKRKLQQNGFVLGHHAKLNPSLLNLDLTIYCGVILKNNTHNNMCHFTKSINDIPYVRECHTVTGSCDFLLKIIVPDITTYRNFLTNSLVPTKNISAIKSVMLVQTTKNEPGIPLEPLVI
jgi:DNA-binding Lrp family transcriptional regulator